MRNALGHRFRRRLSVPDWLEPKLAQEYADKVIAIEPDSLIGYWPMWEGNGAIAYDLSPQGNDGAYTGITLGQEGIGDGRTCPLWDGSNDYNDVFSAGFSADFGYTEGAVFTWARVSGAGIWTDATFRRIFSFTINAGNNLNIGRSSTNNQLRWEHDAGGTSEFVVSTALNGTTDWFNVGMSWTESGDSVTFYQNALPLATRVAIGNWVGAFAAGQMNIGAENQVPSNVWDGYIAHFMVWNMPLSADQFAELRVL